MQGESRLRPWEIRRMTLTEIALARMDPSKAGGRDMSWEEIEEYVAWRRGLTIDETIELAREGRL